MRFWSDTRTRFLAVCIGFCLLGWPFVTGMGIEADEALAGNGFLPNTFAFYSIPVFGRELPLMLLSYVGALKVWLCAPLFWILGPGPVTLRLPSLLIGAATLPLFWLFLRRVRDDTTAWIGTLLLASDTAFLLLTAIDYGPVALQLLLKCGALCLFAVWYRTERSLPFLTACLLTGLAFWDKATFAWIAVGLMAGAVAACPRQLAAVMRLRLLIPGVGALCLGALPLLVYNTAHPLDTFRSNAKLSSDGLSLKTRTLVSTLNGSVFSGFYTAVPPTRPDAKLRTWALGLAVLSLPFVWRTPSRRLALFGLVSFASGWLLMAFTKGAGNAAHHIVLLWPMHVVVVACLLREAPVRWRVPLTTVLVLLSLTTTLRTLSDLNTHGAGIRWTRALYPLARWLETSRADSVMVMDWGIWESLNFLASGRLPVYFGNDYTAPAGPRERELVLREFALRPGTLFLTHAPPFEQVAGVNAALAAYGRRAGLRLDPVAAIPDDQGRTVYEIYRFNVAQ